MSVTINNFSNNLMERKRVIKTTRIQYEIYVKFLEENKPFALGKTDLIANENYFAEKWNELTALLNTSGAGPTRTQQSWKTLLCGWKNQTRSKARKVQANNLLNHQTGNGNLVLTAVEKRALNAWNGVEEYTDYQALPNVPIGITIKRDLSSCHNSPQNDDNESSDEFVPPPRNSIPEPEVFVSMPMDYEQPGVLQEEKYNNIEFENEDINNMTAILVNATNTNTKIIKEVHMATSSALEAVAASVNKVGEALLALAQAQQLAHTNEKLRLEFALAKIKLELAQINNRQH